MSDSEVDFEPESQNPSNPQLFEKHAQVLQTGSFFAVQLSLQTLLEVDFTEKKLRASFFTSNANSNLILLFRPTRFSSNINEQQLNIVIEKAYQLATKLAVDDFAIQKLSEKLELTIETIQIPQIQSVAVEFLSKIAKNPQIRTDFYSYNNIITQLLKQCVQAMFTYNVVSRVFKPVKNVPQTQVQLLNSILNAILQLANSHQYRQHFRSNSMNLLTQLLYSQNQQIKHTTTQILRKLLQVGNIHFLLPHLPHFNSLLQPSETPEFLYSASHILVKIALLGDGDRILTDSGAIQPIIQLFNVEERKIKIAACKVIIGISEQNDVINVKICDTLCLGGVISVLSEACASNFDDKTLLTLLLHALANMCCSQQCQSATRQNFRLHELLVKCISQLDSGVIRYGTLAISNVCAHSAAQKQSAGSLTTSNYFLRENAIYELFSLMMRLVERMYQFSAQEVISCLYGVAEALSTLISDAQIAQKTGIELSNIFQILVKAFKLTEDQKTRASLLKLTANLSKSAENAQIFLEHKIVDFIAFLALEAQISKFPLLQQNVCSAISTISFSAPSYRSSMNKFYGDGSVLSEFGRRGIVGVVCGFLAIDKKEKLSLSEYQTAKNAVSAVCSLSRCCRNCLLMWKEGIVEKLLYCIQIGDNEMKNEAARAIRGVRKGLQGVGECYSKILSDCGGVEGQLIGMYQ
ncbi:hypothetical protein SS50377_23937 [Spironucleus salmonicida]|uniref:Uncharacterized protein n=1 Tax=Spironucleus salmonicida TaxID=348837 RepID=V6LUT2_9EUKA|nr:hypothetical protein SS50377_23937 [Spironucleus salmonicida]|eukprot:EST48330.1 hypothetical protein SS50377_11534 [Spironucleus salmonicida]